jgi:hypothetical protein
MNTDKTYPHQLIFGGYRQHYAPLADGKDHLHAAGLVVQFYNRNNRNGESQ